MKKTIIAAIIALTTTSAFAYDVEMGLTTSINRGAVDTRGQGIALTDHFGPVSITAGVDFFRKGSYHVESLNLMLGYDVYKTNNLTITPKIGASYLDMQIEELDHYALNLGLGFTTPLNKHFNIGFDVLHQIPQKNSQGREANIFTLGLRYKF